MAYDETTDSLVVASTRNPNALYTFRQARGVTARNELKESLPDDPILPLMPEKAQFVPFLNQGDEGLFATVKETLEAVMRKLRIEN